MVVKLNLVHGVSSFSANWTVVKFSEKSNP